MAVFLFDSSTPRARALAVSLAGAFAAGPAAAAPGCETQPGVMACQNLGPFLASATRVTLSKSGSVTAYVGVRTTVRFTNVGPRPLILAYRQGSQKVTDDQGLVYNWNRGSYELKSIAGIGLVTRDSADPQFVLAPGEARDASFEGVLQYSMRREVPGTVYNHDLTIAQLEVVSGRQVRTVRDHAVSFANLMPGGSAAASAGPGGAIGTTAAAVLVSPTPTAAAAPTTGAQPADVAIKLIDLLKQKR